jgi:hypothetical protein
MKDRTFKGYTLTEARKELELWKEAKRAAATGKSYQMGSRMLTRYSLAEINREIDKFADIVDVLSGASGGSPVLVQARMKR